MLRAIRVTLPLLVLMGASVGPAIPAAAAISIARSMASASAVPSLHVEGNRIVDALGRAVILRGVNRSGTEYACIQGWGIFDGPSDAASLAAITSWGTNAVRVPLNEDCWLAINGAPSAYSGQTYQRAIKDYVSLLNQSGLYAILDLHWTAPGTLQATGQLPMPDRDHSLAFWAGVAAAFKSEGAVIFEPFNEPYPDDNRDTAAAWRCWRDGGTCPGMSFAAAGMQEIVATIRATGATNVIAVDGIVYSSSLSQWLANKPSDPLNNLIASWHIYSLSFNNQCKTAACYGATQASAVAAAVPLLVSEVGDDSCDSSWMTMTLDWLDQLGVGYLPWVWDAWGTDCTKMSLIADYRGTPSPYGQVYRDHLARFALPSGTPSPAPIVSPPTPTPAPLVSPPTPTPTPGFCRGGVGPGIAPPTTIASGLEGFHASWYGQSGYPTLCPGQTSTAIVAYYNSGTRGWVARKMGEVAYLGTWNPEPGQDRASILGGDGAAASPSTGWPRYNRVAVQPSEWVGPNQIAWFRFTIVAPPTPGVYRIAIRPLVEGAQWMEDYGVFWYVTVLRADGTRASP